MANWFEVSNFGFQEFSAGGVRTFAVVEGQQSAFPIVLLHGTPAASFVWSTTIAAIGRSRRCIALDLPGWGRSLERNGRPQLVLSRESLRKWLSDVVQAQQIQMFDLLGIGDGALLALEFLQGEGGIIPASTEFVETLKALRKEHGFLIIADEVQAGIGRTGTFFGFEQFDIRPDIVTTAKGLGGGLPLGAILTDDTVASLLQRGMHGTTYGGNAVACAAGAVVVDEVTNSLMENVGKLGLYLRERLLEKAAEFPQLIKEIRGQGFMQGIALNSEMPDFVELMLKRGVVSNITAGSVIRILPPLIAGKEEIDEFIVALRDVLTEKDKAA